jgi:hypothetical protein
MRTSGKRPGSPSLDPHVRESRFIGVQTGGSGTSNILGRLYIRPVPTIDLPDDELAAVTAAIRGVIAGDRYPHAPRLDPLRAALARLEAAGANQNISGDAPTKGLTRKDAPPPGKADKRPR